jgi:RNA polymerase sigma-70 factor (ECF subfamily)
VAVQVNQNHSGLRQRLPLNARLCTSSVAKNKNVLIRVNTTRVLIRETSKPRDLCHYSPPSSGHRMVSIRKNTIDEPCGLTLKDLHAIPDDVLMAHLNSGHDDALAVLFDRYHRLVLKVALKILRDAGEAEDLLQNVFLEIYKAAAQFDPARGTTKVWILQYAYCRSMNRRQQLVSRKFYVSTDISEIPEFPSPHTHSGLGSQETQCLVRASLKTLNSAQKRVLELAYFEGFSLREIAEETGESLGNVRHHYYRGLSTLRRYLKQSGPEAARYRATEIVDADA